MKATLTFPTDGTDEFPYEINGTRYDIPKFTDVIGGMGVSRRAMAAGVDEEDFGHRVLIAFQIAHQDNEKAIRAFEYLTSPQQVELLKKWGEFTGADLPES